jgi:hypothetical protein
MRAKNVVEIDPGSRSDFGSETLVYTLKWQSLKALLNVENGWH